jgi:hypothetical protein
MEPACWPAAMAMDDASTVDFMTAKGNKKDQACSKLKC